MMLKVLIILWNHIIPWASFGKEVRMGRLSPPPDLTSSTEIPMPEAASNTIEISNFIQVTHQPTPDRRSKVSQVGQAMTALLEAEKALDEALAEVVGQEQAEKVLSPLVGSVEFAWDRIDAALARGRPS